jgi:hypothetical protein
MLWLLVDVAEWRTFSDLPDDPKRCVSIILSHRRDFLTADVRGRHMVKLQLAELISPVRVFTPPQIFTVLQQLLLSLQEMPTQIGALPCTFIDSCLAQLTALL